MGVAYNSRIITDGLVLALDAANPKSYPTKNFVSSKIYSSFGSSIRSSNYTVQYSDDNSNWTTAFTGVASNNTSCGIQQNTGSGSGSYGLHRYWRYVEGSPIQSHHPRLSRIILTDINGIDYNLVVYTSDNCSDTGTYQVGTVSLDFGGTTWTDLSTNGNNGTFTTGVTYNGYNRGSLSFDGGDASHIQIVNTAGQVDFPGDFTVGLWIYPTQYHRTYQTMIDTYPGGATNGWIFTTMYSSSQVISWYTEGSSWQPSGTAVTLNAWNYVVASRIGTTVKLYKNATEIHSHSDSSNIRGGVCRIGRGLDDANNYGNVFGRISNVQIYKGKGLTQAEVSQNYNALRGRFGI